MNPEAFLHAPVVIQIHALAAIAALLLGTIMLLRRKGDKVHRWSGRLWVVLMAVVALSGLFIFEIRLIGPFSPIHLLSLAVLAFLVQLVRAVRAGNIAQHRKIVLGLYFGGLIVAGGFTFVPGRLSYQVIVEPMLESGMYIGIWLLAAGLAIASALVLRAN